MRHNQANYILSAVVGVLTINAFAMDNQVRPTTASEIQQQISLRDAEVSQGTVTYQRKFDGHYYRQSLSYAADQRFVAKQLNLFGQQKYMVTQIYDGTDDFLCVDRTKDPYIEITAGQPEDLRESFRRGGMYPGAGYIFGRGLSHLTDFEILRSGKASVTVRGKIPDGSVVEAILDAERGYLAKQIDLKNNVGGIARVVMASPITSTNGIWMPRVTTFQVSKKKAPFVIRVIG